MHLARMAKQLSESVTIYTDGNETLAKDIREAAVTEKTFSVDTRQISEFEKRLEGEKKSVLVHFADGSGTKKEGFLVGSLFPLWSSTMLTNNRFMARSHNRMAPLLSSSG